MKVCGVPMLRLIPVLVLVGFLMFTVNGGFTQTFGAADAVQDSPVTKIVGLDSIIGTMGVTGVLVWYLWYTTASAFPKIRDDFRQEMADERAHHEKLHDKACERIGQLCDSINGLSDMLRQRPCILDRKVGQQ